KNDRTYELLNAYPNEMLYGNDIAHNDVANSFQSLSDQEKQAVYAKFQELIPPRHVPEILPPAPTTPLPPRQPGQIRTNRTNQGQDKSGTNQGDKSGQIRGQIGTNQGQPDLPYFSASI